MLQQFGDGYPGPNCFKSITVEVDGKQADAVIVDEVRANFTIRRFSLYLISVSYVVYGLPLRWSRFLRGSIQLLRAFERRCAYR